MSQRCAFALVLLGGMGSLLSAQPAAGDWLAIEGQFSQDANPADVNLFLLDAQRVLRLNPKVVSANPQLGELGRVVARAYREGSMNLLWRFTPRLVAGASGKAPGEWIDVATSFDFEADHSVIEPGQSVHLTLKPLFGLTHSLKAKYRAEFSLSAAGKLLAQSEPVGISALEEGSTSLRARDLKPGVYSLRYELKNESGEVIARTQRRLRVAERWAARSRALSEAYLSALLKVQPGSLLADAAHFVGFVAEQMRAEQSGHGAGYPDRMHPAAVSGWGGVFEPREITPVSEEDIGIAERWGAELAAGRDPLFGKIGWMRLASKGTDGKLRAYRLHLPAKKIEKMLVAFHGTPGWDGSYLNDYASPDGSSLGTVAAQRGYAVLLPSSSAIGLFFEAQEAREAQSLIQRLRKTLAAERAPLFLMGHQTGGGSAMELGILQDLPVSGIASTAGIPDPIPDPARKPKVSVFFAGSAKDWEYPEQSAYRMKAMFKRGFARFESVEFERNNEFDIPRASFAKILDFFDSVAASPQASQQP
jgi:hypothetical protein